MVKNENIERLADAINKRGSYPALSLIGKKPEVAAAIAKLVKSKDLNTVSIGNTQSLQNLNQSQIQAISHETQNRITDNENIMSLFPDLELAIQIFTSSVLSPKDMVNNDLIYRCKDNIFPPELSLKLNDILSDALDNVYKLRDDSEEILRDALFTSGAHIKAILPESIVDEVINGNQSVSKESLSEIFNPDSSIARIGILGSPDAVPENQLGIGIESFDGKINYGKNYRSYPVGKIGKEEVSLKDFVEVTDNFNVLKIPKVTEVYKRQQLKAIIKGRQRKSETVFSFEDRKITGQELSSILYRDPNSEYSTFATLPSRYNQKRKSVGRPLVMKLPPESVIPVYVPGDPSNHVAYFLLVDEAGNPLQGDPEQKSFEGLQSLLRQSQGSTMSSMLINKAKNNLLNKNGELTVDQMTQVYSSIIETDLSNRFANGLYGKRVKIGATTELYRVMLARALSAKFTRLVYLPADYVTYFAMKFFKNGVGCSYLDGVKNLTSLRAIMLFARVMSQAKSSIATTHVSMELDPGDQDPEKTIEVAQHEIVKLRQMYFPLGINSPMDLADWITRAGLEFSFSGHPRLPSTSFNFETKNLDHAQPNSDLEETLRKQTYMAFGLTPEVVDNGFNPDFATTIVNNNILLSKRVLMIQKLFKNLLTDFVHKVAYSDATLAQEFMAVLQENRGLLEKYLTDEEKAEFSKNEDAFLEDMLERYIEAIEVDLPKPDVTSVDTQLDAMKKYEEAVDATLNYYISADFITSDIAGDISGNIDSVKAVYKAYFMREWMASEGFMSELGDIIVSDDDGHPKIDLMEINKNHMEGVMRSVLDFTKAMAPVRDAANTDLKTLGTPEGSSSGGDFGSDSSSGDDFGMGGDMDMGMGGDMGGMGDMTGDMGNMGGEPAGTETPEETPEANNPEQSNGL